jgi:hypothetical protein
MAPLYPAPEYRQIIEPFAGSAGYAMRYPDRDVLLIDKDPIIVGIWSYLLRVTEAEVLALPDLPAGATVHDLAIPQEARWLVGFWLSRGTSTGKIRASALKWAHLRPDSFWGPHVRERIARQLAAIRHWRIIEGTYHDASDVPATWFVDPPYQQAGKYYRHGSKAIDYADLGAWCRERQGQTIVCEAQGADWLPFSAFGEHKSGTKGRPSAEAVWLSGGLTLPLVTPCHSGVASLSHRLTDGVSDGPTATEARDAHHQDP